MKGVLQLTLQLIVEAVLLHVLTEVQRMIQQHHFTVMDTYTVVVPSDHAIMEILHVQVGLKQMVHWTQFMDGDGTVEILQPIQH